MCKLLNTCRCIKLNCFHATNEHQPINLERQTEIMILKILVEEMKKLNKVICKCVLVYVYVYVYVMLVCASMILILI